jgi:hypothetical protein
MQLGRSQEFLTYKAHSRAQETEGELVLGVKGGAGAKEESADLP